MNSPVNPENNGGTQENDRKTSVMTAYYAGGGALMGACAGITAEAHNASPLVYAGFSLLFIAKAVHGRVGQAVYAPQHSAEKIQVLPDSEA